MRFEDLLERHERGELTQEEAGELLGMSGQNPSEKYFVPTKAAVGLRFYVRAPLAVRAPTA